jgi:Fe-S cluster assembly protein SufB
MLKKRSIDKKYKYGFNDGDVSFFKTNKGINKEIIIEVSKMKGEPSWLTKHRLESYDIFIKMENPNFGPDLSFIDFNDFIYYVRPTDKEQTKWEDVPSKIRNTFKKLGIMEAEAKFLNGVATQYDSEVIYHSMIEELKSKNVIFCDTSKAAIEHEELFKKYFCKVVANNDNKFAALNSCIWSGGSFIYIPKNVKLDLPLQSYFRINAKGTGQFERTLIIVDEGAEVHYIEGCTAPVFSQDNLHAAVVEVIVHKDAKCRYTTIQNWSDNVLNLVTKRAIVHERANMSWIDGNIGARINMKYPSSILIGDSATSDCISIAVANKNVVQDAGAKMIHLAPNTKSTIISKSISFNGGDTRYRGYVRIAKDAINSISKVECDTLILDKISRSDTVPKEIIENNQSTLEHEASVSRISEEQLFYLMSKGLSEEEAQYLVVLGFLEPFSKELPMEYAIELNKLIKLDMEGSVG